MTGVLLAKLKTAGLNNASCARILGFHPSSVGRELKRGAAATAIGYDIRIARKRTRNIRSAATHHRKLHHNQAEQITALIRQYYSPSDFSTIISEQVDLAVNLLNTRPRKRHDYQSPAELLKPYLDVAI